MQAIVNKIVRDRQSGPFHDLPHVAPNVLRDLSIA